METTIGSNRGDSVSYINVEKAARESTTVHWKSIFAGLFVALIVYYGLLSLGFGIGASQVKDVISGEDSAGALGKGLGVWFAVSVLISLFVGSFAASRVSGLIATRVGSIQGVVVSALFFTLMLSQVGAAIGLMGRGTAALTGAAASAAQNADNSQYNMVVQDALGDVRLKAAPETVASGIVSRLIHGNQESAVNYLAAQSNLSRQEANARLAKAKEDLKAAGQQAADAAKAVGWLAFGILLFGTVSSLLGGAFGAQFNIRHPVDDLDRKAMRNPVHV